MPSWALWARTHMLQTPWVTAGGSCGRLFPCGDGQCALPADTVGGELRAGTGPTAVGYTRVCWRVVENAVCGPGRAIEYRLSSTCHIFCFRKTKRCIRAALVRICTPQSTFHMVSRTGPSGTTFQVKSTFSLSVISKLMHVQLKEFNLVITNSALVSPDCRNLSFFRSLFNNVPRLNHSGGKEFIV